MDSWALGLKYDGPVVPWLLGFKYEEAHEPLASDKRGPGTMSPLLQIRGSRGPWALGMDTRDLGPMDTLLYGSPLGPNLYLFLDVHISCLAV